MHKSFIAAVSAGVEDAHKDSRFSQTNGFTIGEHPTLRVYRVDGEAWTFYVVHGEHGWSILGWMEAAQQGISFSA